MGVGIAFQAERTGICKSPEARRSYAVKKTAKIVWLNCRHSAYTCKMGVVMVPTSRTAAVKIKLDDVWKA